MQACKLGHFDETTQATADGPSTLVRLPPATD